MGDDYSLSEEFFRGETAEETRDNQLLHLEAVVLRELVMLFQKHEPDAFGQHIQGCAQRLQMMQHARLEIAEATRESTGPIGPYKVTHLNMCLNAFYVNLRGALDNLAWAATYKFALLPEIDEDDKQTRGFCALSGSRFRDVLVSAEPRAAAWLDGIQLWLKDLALFRDPAAHRLPLTMAPALLTEDEGKKYKALHEEAAQAAESGNWEQYDRLVREANKLGKFVPLLNTPRAPNNGLYIVPNQIASDQRKFLDFTHAFLRFLEA